MYQMFRLIDEAGVNMTGRRSSGIGVGEGMPSPPIVPEIPDDLPDEQKRQLEQKNQDIFDNYIQDLTNYYIKQGSIIDYEKLRKELVNIGITETLQQDKIISDYQRSKFGLKGEGSLQHNYKAPEHIPSISVLLDPNTKLPLRPEKTEYNVFIPKTGSMLLASMKTVEHNYRIKEVPLFQGEEKRIVEKALKLGPVSDKDYEFKNSVLYSLSDYQREQLNLPIQGWKIFNTGTFGQGDFNQLDGKYIF